MSQTGQQAEESGHVCLMRTVCGQEPGSEALEAHPRGLGACRVCTAVAKAVLMMVSPPGVVPTQDVLSMLGDIRRSLVEVRGQRELSSCSLNLWEQGCLP